MKYSEALKLLASIMDERQDIKEVKFDKENDTFIIISEDNSEHICFGSEFR